MKSLFLACTVFFAALPSMAQESVAGDERSIPEKKDSTRIEKMEKSETGKSEPGNGNSFPVDDLIPEQRDSLSLPLLLGLDLLVPGGGHFYRGSYWVGGGFVLFKALGAWSIYHFYRKWDYNRSLYNAAKKANENIDPDHQLLFLTPGGDYRSVKDLKHSYDSAAQKITFAVVANVLLYSASLIINYAAYRRDSEESFPTFTISLATTVSESDMVISLGYTYRM